MKKSIKIIKDSFEMLKYECWHNEEGRKRARKIIDKFHSGYYGSSEGCFIQIARAIKKIEKMTKNKIEDEKLLTKEIKESVCFDTPEEKEIITGLTKEDLEILEKNKALFTPEENKIIEANCEQDNKHKTYFIDTETGGLNPYTDGLCSISITEQSTNLINSPNEADCMTFFIEPQRKLYGQGAFDVNHLSLEFLEERGEQKEIVCLKLKQIMGRSCTLIGHNVEFDLKFLMQLFKECKATIPIIHYIDTLVLAKRHLTKRTKTNNGEVANFKLTTLYQYYFNDFNEKLAHTSDYDVFMTEKLYFKLVKLEK
jgi:DNA polymerase III epsilon subunit-like protein